MKINFFVPIISAVLLGYLCASFIFNQYKITEFSFSEKNNIYYLQCGSYNSFESSKEEIKGVENKITIKKDNKYYSYIGMTHDIKLAEQIKEMYQKNGVDIYIKVDEIDNNEFINELEQYDILLKNSKTLKEINSVLKTILATYDETILNK